MGYAFTAGNIFSCRVGFDKPVGSPGDGVGFPGSCRVLNEVSVTYTILCRMIHDFSNHIELVIPGKEKCLFMKGVCWFTVKFDKMLDDIGNAFRCKHLVP